MSLIFCLSFLCIQVSLDEDPPLRRGIWNAPISVLFFWGWDSGPTLKTLNHSTYAPLSVYPSEEAACPAKRQGEETELGQNFRP